MIGFPTDIWTRSLNKIKPFSSFRQYIKNSVIDGYNTIIDS